MKATIKNLTNGPRELRGVDGPIIVGAMEAITDDFDDLWLLSARQVRYFEIAESTGKRDAPVKEDEPSEKPAMETEPEPDVSQPAPRPRGRPRKDAE